jgi:hypothetical protein
MYHDYNDVDHNHHHQLHLNGYTSIYNDPDAF